MALKNWWWGRSSIIDLHGCDKKMLKDPKAIKIFVIELCKLLKMKRVGPMRIKRFGHGRLLGYSMMQFIETSSIVAHFDEYADRAFIDIFSCKEYNTKNAIDFCKRYFKAKSASSYVKERI